MVKLMLEALDKEHMSAVVPHVAHQVLLGQKFL